MHDVVDYDTFKDRVSDATRATPCPCEKSHGHGPSQRAVAPVQLRPETLTAATADTNAGAGVRRPPASAGRPQHPTSGCVRPLLPPVQPSALLSTCGAADFDRGFIGGVA